MATGGNATGGEKTEKRVGSKLMKASTRSKRAKGEGPVALPAAQKIRAAPNPATSPLAKVSPVPGRLERQMAPKANHRGENGGENSRTAAAEPAEKSSAVKRKAAKTKLPLADDAAAQPHEEGEGGGGGKKKRKKKAKKEGTSGKGGEKRKRDESESEEPGVKSAGPGTEPEARPRGEEKRPRKKHMVVPLETAAESGCRKCRLELETGEKTRQSHDERCPRKWSPREAAAVPAAAPAANRSEDAVPPQDTGDLTMAGPPLSVNGIPEDASPSKQVHLATQMVVKSMADRVEEYKKERAAFIERNKEFRQGLLEGIAVEAERMITDLEARDCQQIRSKNEQIVRTARWKEAEAASLGKLPNEINSNLYVPARADELEAARAKGVLVGQVGEFARGFCCCAFFVVVAYFLAGY